MNQPQDRDEDLRRMAQMEEEYARRDERTRCGDGITVSMTREQLLSAIERGEYFYGFDNAILRDPHFKP